MRIHPSDDVLEELLLSLSSERLAVLDHMAGCPVCRTRLYHLPRRDVPEASPPDCSAALDPAAAHPGTVDFDRAQERDAAPCLYPELIATPPEELDLRLRSSQRFHTWGLLELLVERSLEVTIRDPRQGEELGQLALRLAGHMDAARYGPGAIEDLAARAWAHVANARRLRSDLSGAEEAFFAARRRLRQGTGDAVEQAIVDDLEASLLRDQRRWDEAVARLQRAIAAFRAAGEIHRAGRSLLILSTVHNQSGDPAKAVPLLHQALDLLDPEQEPRLQLCARHNLAFYLADLGRFSEAWRLYREARPLYRRFPDGWTRNRRRWVKAKIVRGVGHPALAESLLLAARDGFVAEGVPYDTALVSLELATLYAEQGRAADLKRLAGEMLPIFSSLHIHREALAALGFLRQAAEAERASRELVAGVAAFLKRAQHDPTLRFEAPPV